MNVSLFSVHVPWLVYCSSMELERKWMGFLWSCVPSPSKRQQETHSNPSVTSRQSDGIPTSSLWKLHLEKPTATLSALASNLELSLFQLPKNASSHLKTCKDFPSPPAPRNRREASNPSNGSPQLLSIWHQHSGCEEGSHDVYQDSTMTIHVAAKIWTTWVVLSIMLNNCWPWSLDCITWARLTSDPMILTK